MSQLDEILKTVNERGYYLPEEMYQTIVLKYGPPKNVVVPDHKTISSYKGRLPDSLLRLWAEQGWGSWQQGKIWLCDPEFLKPVTEELFESDPEFSAENVIPFAYSAFGELFLWIKDYTYMSVNPCYDKASLNTMINYDKNSNTNITSSNSFIYSLYAMIAPFMPSLEDGNNKDMLPQAIKRLGELTPGEIYGFFPAITMGGELNAKYLQKTHIREHLSFLFQVQKPMLMEYIPPKEEEVSYGNLNSIRRLGAQ